MPTWKEAQGDVLRLLVDVRKLVDTKDESGVLELINQQDAFCDQAKADQSSKGQGDAESACHFCQGFIQGGGCLGRLDAIDHAVLHVGSKNLAEGVVAVVEIARCRRSHRRFGGSAGESDCQGKKEEREMIFHGRESRMPLRNRRTGRFSLSIFACAVSVM